MVAISHIPDSRTLVLLGDTFSRNFYTTFNYDQNVVSMGANSAAFVGQSAEREFARFNIFLIGVLISMACCFCVSLCKKNKKDQIEVDEDLLDPSASFTAPADRVRENEQIFF